VLAALATLQHLSASHVVDNADRLSRCSALTALTAVELKHVRLCILQINQQTASVDLLVHQGRPEQMYHARHMP
jgi:hypothetical protein